jgi:transposase InsO family protein
MSKSKTDGTTLVYWLTSIIERSLALAQARKRMPPPGRAYLCLCQGELRQIQFFHTDRGSEFKNKLIDDTLTTFQISRSLSMKGCPYDKSVAEATVKIMKTEFIHQMNFQSLQHLDLERT